MWLKGYWLTDYWLDGYWLASKDAIRYGTGIRLGAKWKLGSDIFSNPGEYNPYTRSIPGSTTPSFAAELYFGGGAFGGGQFGVGEKLWAPTFAPETPSTPIYV